MKRVEVLLGELDELQGQHAEMTPEERVKELGHPKELHEKLWQACQSVKATYEDLPKLVERMEQRKRVHEACAQVMLGIAELESQQKLMIQRFGENAELMKEVREGMAENLAICRANAKLIRK